MTTQTSRIQRLPQAVADAIAAGEVIERPASVVKELCENALDAGASRVDVELEGGGLVRIAVVDDGHGIAGGDLALAVSRHATSKIASERDLERVATLGFRGEALASIAAVSDLRITSRIDGVDAAATIRVRAGEVVESGTAPAPVGTRLEVCELFATTPARLRFLRELRTEAALASRMVAELALAHPGVAFTSRSDRRTTLRTGAGTRRDAARAVFGAQSEPHMIDVQTTGAVAVEGLISEPLVHRGTRAGLVLVLNGRRVHNRALMVAVEEAYRGLLPQGRHPFGLVVIEVDPADVDVNVHPTKREVRFRDERAVFSAVQRACWSALGARPVFSAPAPVAVSATHWPPEDTLVTLTVAEGEERPSGLPPVDAPPALRAVGQIRGEWIVAEGPSGVVLVDPHAAHEKILYVELIDQWTHGERGTPDSQLLLMPALVECDPAQMSRAEGSSAFLDSCGFGLEVFGPGLLRCTAVPIAAAGSDAATLVLGVLDSLDEDSPPEHRNHRIAAMVACHSAVRFGDRLDAGQQQRLLERLAVTPGGMTCPHGRPTTLSLDDADLRRAFRRPGR